ncbi:MAG: hypothetical protein ABSG94_02690 [Brevinematales bacterium]|jgi:hypothetical protein
MPDIKMENTYIVIKGRFRAPSSSSFGVFIIFLDNMTKNVDKYDIVSSHFSTLYENNVNMPWHEFEDIISKLKWRGEYATSLTHDIQASFDDIFQAGTGRTQDIWSNVKKAQISKVSDIFDEVLARPTTDKAVKCEIAAESIMKSEIEEAKKFRSEREAKELLSGTEKDSKPQPDGSTPEVGESAVILEVSLILSPISGIPIYDLKEGDKIFIKITEQSSRGQYFIDLLNASENNEIIPIPATVVKMTKEGKIYTVLVSVGPGIYGKSLDEDTVKVKKYDPAEDKRKKKPAAEEVSFAQPTANISEAAKKPASMNMIFILIGITAFIVIIILIWLLL